MRRRSKSAPSPLGAKLAAVAGVLLFATSVRADYKSDVGYTELQAELGGALPSGAGVSVTQAEAAIDSSGSYQPDTSNPEFTGKSLVFESGTPGISWHATMVGQYYYGTSTSLAPGIGTVDVYEADAWIGSGFLNYYSGSTAAPLAEPNAFENHSWIDSFGDTTADTEVLRRFDYAIQQGNFLAAVGLNNGAGTAIPALLGSSYNGIVVGLTSGSHSSGTTTIDGTGRVKPDLVSPIDLTSFATPTIGAAGALLLQQARGNPSLASATNSVVLKALLLAGATKSQFPTWSRTTTQPLDAHYGAGQLNIYNSYHLLVAGQQASSGSASVRSRGWDFATTATGGRFYFFDILPGNLSPGFSAVLTWNRVIANTLGPVAWGSPSSTLPNLSLNLYSASGFTPGGLVDSSTSTVDNVQHIYQPGLAPGRYALEVTVAGASNVNYGLAWNSVPTAGIAATAPSAFEQGPVSGTFTVTRAGDATDLLTVHYSIGGTATNGTDYIAIGNAVTIPAGATSATITITPIPDTVAEGDRTVTLTLAANLAYSVGTAASATLTIHDLPFDAWRFGNFTPAELNDPAISGPTADPDHDGVSNLLEYALGLDPKTPDASGLPVAGLANGSLTLTYTRVKSATDITYTPEVSTDLATWNSGSAYTSEIQATDLGATQTVTVASLIPLSSFPTQFIRLKVSRP